MHVVIIALQSFYGVVVREAIEQIKCHVSSFALMWAKQSNMLQRYNLFCKLHSTLPDFCKNYFVFLSFGLEYYLFQPT